MGISNSILEIRCTILEGVWQHGQQRAHEHDVPCLATSDSHSSQLVKFNGVQLLLCGSERGKYTKEKGTKD